MKKNRFFFCILFLVSGCSNSGSAPSSTDSSGIPKVVKALPLSLPTSYTCCTNSHGDIDLSQPVSGAGGKAFLEFGGVITGPGGTVELPHYTWQAVNNSQVQSPIDGVICSIEANPSAPANDEEIHISSSSSDCSIWMVTLDHLDVTDTLTAGTTVTAGNEIGRTLNGVKLEFDIVSGSSHWCPGYYFTDSTSADLQLRITTMMSAQEQYSSNTALYDQSAMTVPGCKQQSYSE